MACEGPDVGEAAPRWADSDLVAASSVSLKPTSDIGSWNVTARGDVTALYRNVDDGTSFTTADDATTMVQSTAGSPTASFKVGFSGAPAGGATAVAANYRVQGSGARGTAQIELYDGDTFLQRGAARPVTSGTWSNYTDTFGGLAVADANRLRARVIFTNESGKGSLAATALWLTVTASDPLANVHQSCGTWVLDQVSSLRDYTNDALDTALATPSLRGLSIRVGWKDVQSDFSLFDGGLTKLSAQPNLAYTIRFMAGSSTPDNLLTDAAYYYTFGQKKIPTPFRNAAPNLSAAGNPAFEAAFEGMISKMASYARAHGIRLIHLSWYGRDWAELNCDESLTSQPGFTYAGWLTAHKRLIDIALRYAGSDLAVEFPMSGHVDRLKCGSAQKDILDYLESRLDDFSPLLFLQGNGLPDYATGAPAQGRPIFYGRQMATAHDYPNATSSYTWADIYGFLNTSPERATYLEVYKESFVGAHRDVLRAQVAQFAKGCSL
jgi:hypothetical protein